MTASAIAIAKPPASQCSPTQAISWQKKEKIRCTTPSTQTKQLLRNISKKLWTLIISSFHHLCLLFWGPFNFLHDLDITLRYDDTTLRCNNLATLVLTKNIQYMQTVNKQQFTSVIIKDSLLTLAQHENTKKKKL